MTAVAMNLTDLPSEVRSKVWHYSDSLAVEVVIEDGVDEPMDRNNLILSERVNIVNRHEALEKAIRQ